MLMLCTCLMQRSTFTENCYCVPNFKKQQQIEQPDFTMPPFAQIVFSFITLTSTNFCNLTIYSYLHYIRNVLLNGMAAETHLIHSIKGRVP
jgi:hypothetical protein